LQEASTRFAMYANTNDSVLAGAGNKPEQYIASCSLGGVPCNVKRDFRSNFHPYYFNCSMYVPKSGAAATDDDGGSNSKEDLPWLMPGLDNGLSMVVLTGSGMVEKYEDMQVSTVFEFRSSRTF